MWSLKCPSGIPIDALCRDLSFCWLLNYFLKFPQLFIVLFDLQKGYWSRSFFFPSDQMRRAKFMDIFQERNDLLIRVNYVKERAKIEFGFCSPYLILLISVFATCLLYFPLQSESPVGWNWWHDQLSTVTTRGKFFLWGSCNKIRAKAFIK